MIPPPVFDNYIIPNTGGGIYFFSGLSVLQGDHRTHEEVGAQRQKSRAYMIPPDEQHHDETREHSNNDGRAKMRQKGDKVSGRTVGKYMREIGIWACYRKHRTRTTRDSDFSSGLKNILDRDFQPERPDAAWCTDITCIWTMEGFVYLASIMDLYSRKIISWTLGETLETKWVLEAVEKAKRERCVEQPLVIHSDRGVQYTCGDYEEATGGMERSYSAKACPLLNPFLQKP